MPLTCPACGSANDDDLKACFTCGHAFTPEQTPIRQGVLIAARYEIVERLGKGGMGAVYRARDRVLEEDVALKVLREDLNQAELAKRFRTEIKLARRVVHRNVCRIYEYGEDERRHFIAMELIRGTDLKQVLKERGALSPADAYSVAIQVARGLQAIHEVGVIHRDLKAPNIMIDDHGVVRLMDFGIAKEVLSAEAATAPATATGHIVGTPDYMSPEQARGAKVDFRSDIYSLGVLVFEMFTGELPFRSDTPVATILKHLHDPPPLDGPKAARIPASVKPVIARALAKDADSRYKSAREFADALRQAEALGPAGSSPPTLSRAIPIVGNTLVAPHVPITDSFSTPVPASTPQPRSSVPPSIVPTVLLSSAAAVRSRAKAAPQSPSSTSAHHTSVIAVAAGALVALGFAVGFGAWLVRIVRLPSQPPPVSTLLPSLQSTIPASVVVRINALPWARVRVTALDPKASVPRLSDVDRTTPLQIDLREGEYSLELENGGVTKPLTQRITVRTGQPAEFAFTMPDYNPEAAIEKSGWRR